MWPKFKRKISQFLSWAKLPFLFLLIFLGFLFLTYLKPNLKPSFWWSVVFQNPVKQTGGTTNLLILGVSGGSHAGSDLTDTMILTSFNSPKEKTILVSLPRDIWSPTLAAKINSAYHYGQEKGPGEGLNLAKTTTEEITGLPVHYVAKIDLAGVKEIVDLLGGVEVNIDRSFDDYKFPIEGKENDLCNGDKEYKCRYQKVHFDAGRQILTGEQALKYLRSRHAEGDEGTDFARSQRQQKILLALKDKIFSLTFLPKSREFLKVLGKIIETDIPQEDLPYLGKLILKTNFHTAKSLNLEDFLINPPLWQYGQWVLTPKTEDFRDIHQYLREQILN
ncbi:MAG: LCP family protein [Patescibacteria group bacterium]|nr:LCP family protein [Patescibacteria group bacterium]MCL5095905.1 LCP family protein [Patescibacteria group bacterium]